MEPIRLNDRQVAELEKVQRLIGDLQGRQRAMVEMALASADVDPQTPVRFERRDGGLYLAEMPAPKEAPAEAD